MRLLSKLTLISTLIVLLGCVDQDALDRQVAPFPRVEIERFSRPVGDEPRYAPLLLVRPDATVQVVDELAVFFASDFGQRMEEEKRFLYSGSIAGAEEFELFLDGFNQLYDQEERILLSGLHLGVSIRIQQADGEVREILLPSPIHSEKSEASEALWKKLFDIRLKEMSEGEADGFDLRA